MPFEHQADSGSLFKNDRKEKESQPDYKGDALVGGKLYRLSAWLNEAKSGTKYLSVKFSEKERTDEKPQTLAEKAAASGTAPVDDFGDSSLPF